MYLASKLAASIHGHHCYVYTYKVMCMWTANSERYVPSIYSKYNLYWRIGVLAYSIAWESEIDDRAKKVTMLHVTNCFAARLQAQGSKGLDLKLRTGISICFGTI